MNYQFFNEDCFERMQKMPDKNIELILTDIPYGISYNNNGWDKFDDYCAFLNKLLSNFKRILKDDGVIWMFCAPTMFDIVDKAITDCGLINHYDFWKSIQRQKGRGAKSKPKSQREDILLITKTNNYTFNNLSDIFKYDETVTNTLDVTIGGDNFDTTKITCKNDGSATKKEVTPKDSGKDTKAGSAGT